MLNVYSYVGYQNTAFLNSDVVCNWQFQFEKNFIIKSLYIKQGLQLYNYDRKCC